ncbi:MAG: class I SAM-dependent methyltransferase [Anaeromyxobacter sp.]|nr:class I SAM-dependent methyltransferase [Anaeromyxobacter sp.]
MRKQDDPAYFDEIAERYRQTSGSWGEIYVQVGQLLNPMVAGRVVLDVGNGGHFPYDPSLPGKLMAMDISAEMLEPIHDPKVTKIVGDARDMKQVKDGSVDVILFQLTIHHINGPTRAETLQILAELVEAAHRKLGPGGRLVIVEALVSPVLAAIQRLLFPLTRWLLRSLGASMVFFFRKSEIEDCLVARFGIGAGPVTIHPIRLTEPIDPLGGTFPGLIKVPAWAQPWSFTVFVVEKSLT